MRFYAQLLRVMYMSVRKPGTVGIHVLSPSLRLAPKILYEIMLLALLCLTKPSNRAVHGAVLLAPASMQVRFCASLLDFGSCFWDFCSFSYFLPGLFSAFGLSLGAVLGISAVSATFSRLFSGFWAEFGVLFWGFLLFQLLFLGFFPAFGLSLGYCFGDFCSFSYLFSAFFQLLGWI